MLSHLFVMLFLLSMILFIVYHFYVDYSNWSNTGNTFAEGMTGNVCITEDSCKKVAESLGLKIGGGGYAFAESYSTKGLYAYKSGKYSGMAFFGKGGTEAQMKQPLKHPKYRPTPPPAATDEKVPQKGTFISNEGKKWENQIPFKVSKNIYVFGGFDGGWFKMASIDSNGNFIENRHTKESNSIDELTIEIWNSANKGGDYKVEDIIFVLAAPQQSSEATAMNNKISSRAGNVAPMDSNVPQNCKPGCVAPNGPSGNCKNIQQQGKL